MNYNFRIRNIALITVLLFCLATHGQSVKKIKITDLQKTIAESKQPLIVNFWATYCKPCLEEIPYFQELTKKYKTDSVTLLLVSLDLQEAYPAQIKNFAIKRKLTAPIQWLDEFNADYFCPKVDSAWSGAIPATLFVNNKMGYRKFFEAQLSREKFEKEIIAALKTN